MTSVQQMTDEELSRWIAERVYPGHDWTNQHRDMVNDPAMSMMLLEKLIPITSIFRHPGGSQKDGDIHLEKDSSAFGCAKTLGRAIAEAYALSLGDEPK